MAGAAINFYMLPNEFNKMKEYNGVKITRTSKDVFEVIWALCKGGKRIYKTAIARIAELASCCEKSVYNAITALEKAGLIMVKHGGDKRMLDEFQVVDILEYKESQSKATVKITPVKKHTNINNNTNTDICLSTSLPTESRNVDKQTNRDFELLKNDSFLDQDILAELKKYYFTILNTQKEYYTISGQRISRKEVISKMKSLNYSNFRNIVCHIRAMKTNANWTMQSSFAFYLTCFINEADGVTPTKSNPVKKSNSFFAFMQRDIDFDELAKKVFKN